MTPASPRLPELQTIKISRLEVYKRYILYLVIQHPPIELQADAAIISVVLFIIRDGHSFQHSLFKVRLVITTVHCVYEPKEKVFLCYSSRA